MNKEQLIKLVDSLSLIEDEYAILSSGSLVIRGLREIANDLDLHITNKCFNYIKDNFEIYDKDPMHMDKDLHYAFKDLNIEFFVMDKKDMKYDYVDGYPVQDLLIILDFKLERNAEKDQKDIDNICSYLNIELRDLYDENRVLTGKRIRKTDKVPKGYYYNTVAVYIENSNGEFLIQKRSKIKGGKWATTGGHPKAGENSIDGLYTEVKEELGIEIDRSKLKLVNSIRTEDDFFDLYHINMEIDLNDIVMEKEEVSDVKWATTDEIYSMINNNTYKISHGIMFKDCMKFIKNS